MVKQKQVKQCNKCNNTLSLDNFRIRGNGFFSYCKSCEKEYSKIYRKNNKEIMKKSKSEYYFNNVNEIKIKQKEYRENNKDILLFKKREQSKVYRENNKDKILKYRKKYNKSLSCKISKKNYKHRRRAIEKVGDLTHKQLLKLENNINKCYWCNNKIINNNYHIDHYVPLSKGGEHTINNLVVSCPNCNLKKGNKDPYEFALTKGKLL